MNKRIIDYLNVNSIDINFENILKISLIMFTLLKLLKRDVKT